MKTRILNELEALKDKIEWNNSGSARSIKDALEELKEGRDIGWEGTKDLMPSSEDFHHWMHYAYLLTIIHNRDCEPKRYSITRKKDIIYFRKFRIFKLGGGGRFVNPKKGFILAPSCQKTIITVNI